MITRKQAFLNYSRNLKVFKAFYCMVENLAKMTELVFVCNRNSVGKISGTGCMAGSCMAAFSAAALPYDAAVSAFCMLGTAGEIAAAKAAGPGTFKPAFFDAAANLTADDFIKYAKIKEVVL